MMLKLLLATLTLFVSPVLGEVNYQAPELVSENGALDVVLNITYEYTLNGTRFSPQYNGGPVGPTLRVKPGDVLTVTLNNNLPPSSARDLELLSYIQDPQNEIDDFVNVTKIYNNLDAIGNIYNPEFGYWGFNLANLHFHGAGFSPSIEALYDPIDGGQSRTYTYQISDDHPPGLVWYHSHIHGHAVFEMMSGLFGAMVIEGTANDVTMVPEIGNATEVIMIVSEVLVDEETGIPPPFLPIVMAFNWVSVVNGMLAEETEFEFQQGETVLFRVIGAGVEPTIRLYFNNSNAPDFLAVAEDGFPVPELEFTDVLRVNTGSRMEFMVKFDEVGTFDLRRLPWNLGITGVEACTAVFNIPVEKCLSYDLDTPIATITVVEADSTDPPIELSLPTSLPDYHPVYKEMEQMPVVTTRTVELAQGEGFPLFQIPYDGPFVPPGVGFGINNLLVTPHYRHGEIIAGTCEEWTVTSHPPGAEHSFHMHTNPFLVTHEDGIPVAEPFWRDTYSIYGYNFTLKACFNDLQPGEYVLVHCHQVAHVDIGMAAFYAVVEGNMTELATPVPDGVEIERVGDEEDTDEEISAFPDESSGDVDVERNADESTGDMKSAATSWTSKGSLIMLLSCALASIAGGK